MHVACLECLHALKSQFGSSCEHYLQLLVQRNTPAAAPAVTTAATAARAPPTVAAVLPGGPAPAAAAPLPARAQVALLATPHRTATVPTAQRTPVAPAQAVDTTSYSERYSICTTRSRDLRPYLVKHPSLTKVQSSGQLAIRGTVIPVSSFIEPARTVRDASQQRETLRAWVISWPLDAQPAYRARRSRHLPRAQYAGMRPANRDENVSASGYSGQKAINQFRNGRMTAQMVPIKTGQSEWGGLVVSGVSPLCVCVCTRWTYAFIYFGNLH